MSVGIIGIGFVGDAIQHSLTQKKINLKLYDKYKNGGIGKPEDILDTQILFLCLPTPFCQEKKTYDITPLIETCEYLAEKDYQGTVVIKSTVTPGTSQMLNDKYKLDIIHNPEFLTARTAREDFHNQKHIVLGLTKNVRFLNHELLIEFYHQNYPEAEITIGSSEESEAMKLFVNSFYATKVQIFNEFYQLSQKLGADYNAIRNMMLKNGWINPMHTTVPGPDGQLSYGGACFPKDTQALLAFMKNQESEHQILDACVQERNAMRDD